MTLSSCLLSTLRTGTLWPFLAGTMTTRMRPPTARNRTTYSSDRCRRTRQTARTIWNRRASTSTRREGDESASEGEGVSEWSCTWRLVFDNRLNGRNNSSIDHHSSVYLRCYVALRLLFWISGNCTSGLAEINDCTSSDRFYSAL